MGDKSHVPDLGESERAIREGTAEVSCSPHASHVQHHRHHSAFAAAARRSGAPDGARGLSPTDQGASLELSAGGTRMRDKHGLTATKKKIGIVAWISQLVLLTIGTASCKPSPAAQQHKASSVPYQANAV